MILTAEKHNFLSEDLLLEPVEKANLSFLDKMQYKRILMTPSSSMEDLSKFLRSRSSIDITAATSASHDDPDGDSADVNSNDKHRFGDYDDAVVLSPAEKKFKRELEKSFEKLDTEAVKVLSSQHVLELKIANDEKEKEITRLNEENLNLVTKIDLLEEKLKLQVAERDDEKDLLLNKIAGMEEKLRLQDEEIEKNIIITQKQGVEVNHLIEKISLSEKGLVEITKTHALKDKITSKRLLREHLNTLFSMCVVLTYAYSIYVKRPLEAIILGSMWFLSIIFKNLPLGLMVGLWSFTFAAVWEFLLQAEDSVFVDAVDGNIVTEGISNGIHYLRGYFNLLWAYFTESKESKI